MAAKANQLRTCMQENQIKLPAFLIADLYSDVLVDIDRTETVTTKKVVDKEPDRIKFFGENQKSVVVILRDEDSIFISDQALEFLSKILKACNFNLSDIAIVNTHLQGVTYEEIKQEIRIDYMLLFGVEPSTLKLPFIIPYFQANQFSNCTFVTAPPLQIMMEQTAESKLLKTKMWMTLRNVFNLD